MAAHTIRFGLPTSYTWKCKERGGVAPADFTSVATLELQLFRIGAQQPAAVFPLTRSVTPSDGEATLTLAPNDFLTLTDGSLWKMEIIATPVPNGSINGHYPDGARDTLQVTS